MKLFTFIALLFTGSAIFAQTFEWTSQNSGVTTSLNDVYFTDAQTGWAVGDNGVIVYTTDGGQTWAGQTSGTTERLKAVFFIDADKGWAVGGSTKKTMLRTIDGGSTWEDISANNIPNAVMLDVAFADANTGWVISGDSVYMTTDGGDVWVKEDLSNTMTSQKLQALVVTSDTTAFAGGSNKLSNTSRNAIVIYRNNETSPAKWDISPFDPSTTDDEFISLAFTSAKIGFAGGKMGKLYRKSGPDDLSSWKLNLDLSADGATYINSVSFPNDDNGMLCYAKTISDVSYTYINFTSDMGDNWSSVPDSIADLSSPVLFAPDTANAWVVGFGGKIFKGERIITGVSPLHFAKDVRVYPNPATEVVHVDIHAGNNEAVVYTLLDMTGRTVQQGVWNVSSSGSRFSLNVSAEPRGVYLLRLSTDEGRSTFRILKY